MTTIEEAEQEARTLAAALRASYRLGTGHTARGHIHDGQTKERTLWALLNRLPADRRMAVLMEGRG